ncbi:hypothetical protein TCAL_03387 [Tigriopus californicus]|uniref:PH domain-containing protein n=1 Tax=Tigriopus californicus TaxID=6832 RepID=A0A553P3Q7_TIGCA|nr:uncharacterized protein LOC131882916 [Tigriopus californicus]TRY72272.1 hypothetical protein TCAL_03387 [Tigriopus californicus]
MVLEAKSDQDRKTWSAAAHNQANSAGGTGAAAVDHHSWAFGRMPYVFVRENAIKYWCTVQGLSHNEVRVLAEKVQDQPEHHDDRQKRAEFSLPTWIILNALELMGFKVVTSGPYVTGTAKHDQREFVWTLHKAHDEWESSSK